MLTDKQHIKLDNIGHSDPLSIVTGSLGVVELRGNEVCDIPIIRRSDGRYQKLLPSGRLVAIKEPVG